MSMSMPDTSTEVITPVFQPVRLVLVVLGILLLVFYASRWYVAQVSLPRYCQQPEMVLQRLAAINTESRPAGDKSRRDYIVAAKLEFLVPARADEPMDAYLLRLKALLEENCR
jgi:hypothetical protein